MLSDDERIAMTKPPVTEAPELGRHNRAFVASRLRADGHSVSQDRTVHSAKTSRLRAKSHGVAFIA